MNHKQEHELRHKKEHEAKIAREKESEKKWEQTPRSIHPAWFVVIGVVLIGAVVLTWTFFFL